jgi:hypothetical protein
MSMEFFEGARTESKAPQVTVRRSGQMVLTAATVAMLGEGVSHVQFGWDADARAVALRPAPKGAKGRYRLRAQANGSSLVDSRRFLAHHGVELEKAETFPAEEFGSGIIGFRFDEAETGTRGEAAAKVEAETATPAAESKPTPITERKPARTGKRKVTAAAA